MNTINQNPHQHTFLIIGQGAIGLPVTNNLATQDYSVTGLARQNQSHYPLHDNAKFIQADATELTLEQVQPFSHIAIIVTPDEHSMAGYQNSYLAICQHLSKLADDLNQLQRLVFISSTGVYGQNHGEWIDENTQPVLPEAASSQVISQAENTLAEAFKQKLTVIRPSGIYGKDRMMRIRQAMSPDLEVADSHWTNRIMDTDLVTIIVNVLTTDTPKSLYLATDYQTVTSAELMNWLTAKMGQNQPHINKQAHMTGKRIHSNIPLAWLEFADWKSGYQAILENK